MPWGELAARPLEHPMRVVARTTALAGLVLILLAVLACQSRSRFAEYQAKDPLAVSKKPKHIIGSADDNYWCYVCHMNYQIEPLAVRHAKAGVGCSKCHGKSEKHTADEDGVIPPKKMFAKEEINSSCLPCHKEYAESAAICLYQPDALGAMETGPSQCTDCHGRHQLANRTRRWDKASGKLLWRDGTKPVRQKTGMDSNDVGEM
jgi:hypothetical protein